MVELHIGEIIEERLKEVGMTKSEFARRINRARQNINDILRRKSVDTDLLFEISKALSYNFFKVYDLELRSMEESSDKVIKEPSSGYSSQEDQLQECKDELSEAQKEITYLKKINNLLEEQLKND